MSQYLPDPDTFRAWLEVLGLVVPALLAAWRYSRSEQAKDKAHRWDTIRAHVPEAHRLAKKVAEATPTPTDDAFIEKMEKFLAPLGYKLEPHEIEAVKALGSAEEQEYKRQDVLALGKPSEADGRPVL